MQAPTNIQVTHT